MPRSSTKTARHFCIKEKEKVTTPLGSFWRRRRTASWALLLPYNPRLWLLSNSASLICTVSSTRKYRSTYGLSLSSGGTPGSPRRSHTHPNLVNSAWESVHNVQCNLIIVRNIVSSTRPRIIQFVWENLAETTTCLKTWPSCCKNFFSWWRPGADLERVSWCSSTDDVWWWCRSDGCDSGRSSGASTLIPALVRNSFWNIFVCIRKNTKGTLLRWDMNEWIIHISNEQSKSSIIRVSDWDESNETLLWWW